MSVLQQPKAYGKENHFIMATGLRKQIGVQKDGQGQDCWTEQEAERNMKVGKEIGD